MPSPIFRLARPRDARLIALMSRQLIETGLTDWYWPPERVTRAIASSRINTLVVTVSGRLIAFAIMEYGDTQAHLCLLAVKPGHQRCGIGKQMMIWLEETALTAGIAGITLELRANNRAARDFYLARGFTQTACIPGYYRGVENALRMSRDIRRQISDRIN